MEAQTTPRSYWSFPQPVCLCRRYLLAKRQHSSICLIRLLLRPRMLLAILIHIRIVRWFNPVFGNSLTFAGLGAGIDKRHRSNRTARRGPQARTRPARAGFGSVPYGKPSALGKMEGEMQSV